MPRKPKAVAAGAPEWMVTYGDMMTLLLCFFVILVAMSEIKADKKFQDVMQSIKAAFGYEGGIGAVPSTTPPKISLKQILETIVIPKKPKKLGDSDDEGIDGKVFRVTQIREGLQFAVGGRISFPRFSAELLPEGEVLIGKLADRIRGHNTKITVRGHATSEPLPDDSPFPDRLALSTARARAVFKALVGHGVRPRRISITGCGDHELLQRQAYNETRRAVNRRVEIIVNEALINEYEGDPLPREEALSDGR